jgi:hypothetical protein
MNIEGKVECVLDQEITVKNGGLQTTYISACVVMESGISIPITLEAAKQIRQWKEGCTVRISGVGQPLLEIECLS